MKNSPPLNDLRTRGYLVLQGPYVVHSKWSSLLNQTIQYNLTSFQKSWNNLPADNFLSDGGHYRFRRYAVFTWQNKTTKSEQKFTLLPHEPHFQTTYRNNMNGGINRNFAPFEGHTTNHPLLYNIIEFICPLFTFKNEKSWRIQAHQFRIVANSKEAGNPTPEGIHRDGADFILIMVLKRQNIKGGVNHIYDNNKRMVFGAILADAGDAILLDDSKVWHGVSEVYPIDSSKEAYRDVLVLTFHYNTLA